MPVVTSAKQNLPAPKSPPPQVGFNNNVKHRGRVFHIQTEDSGVNRPHLITHLFVDGGRIIRSTRSDYAELVGSAELPLLVRKRMKEQHKAMFVALRRGQLDEVIDQALGLVAAPAPASKQPSEPVPAPSNSYPSVIPSSKLRRSRPPVTFTRPRAPSLLGIAESESSSPPSPPVMKGSGRPILELEMEPASDSERAREDKSGAPRPALTQGGDPSSLYGDGKIGEKSLDDVILSYISDDLTPSDKA
jgi:hypothetical protein